MAGTRFGSRAEAALPANGFNYNSWRRGQARACQESPSGYWYCLNLFNSVLPTM